MPSRKGFSTGTIREQRTCHTWIVDGARLLGVGTYRLWGWASTPTIDVMSSRRAVRGTALVLREPDSDEMQWLITTTTQPEGRSGSTADAPH